MPSGQFIDVMACGPDFDAWPGSQDYGAHAIFGESLQRSDQGFGKGRAERVALFEMIETDGADRCLDIGFDQRHGETPWTTAFLAS